MASVALITASRTEDQARRGLALPRCCAASDASATIGTHWKTAESLLGILARFWLPTYLLKLSTTRLPGSQGLHFYE
jgi:hypothetical protein